MEQLQQVLAAMARQISTKTAQEVASLIDRGEWRELQRLRAHPSAYTDSEAFWADAVLVDLLRKVPLPGSDVKDAARQSFLMNEQTCARTNARLAYGCETTLPWLKLVRSEVRRILGGACPVGALEYELTAGSTLSDKSNLTTAPDKLSSRPTLYQHSEALLEPLWSGSPWGRTRFGLGANAYECPDIVRGNRFFSVPKNSETERGCAVEASLNIAYQRGVGVHIRGLLARRGIDLLNGQEVHQRLARDASVHGHLATLDLSNASDLWSTQAVKLLLPKSWFDCLNSLRAKFTQVGDRWIYLSKFSSMGNGFTFELETVLFLSVARTACLLTGISPEPCRCYGDDIILPTEAAQKAVELLAELGHNLNENKSYIKGPFRESCGGDFFGGRRVNTLKLQEIPTEPQQWMALANGLRRISEGCPHRWALIKPAWDVVMTFIPSAIRACTGPSELGDCVIHTPPADWAIKEKPNGLRKIRVYKPFTRRVSLDHFWPEVLFTACTLVESSGVVPRDAVDGYRLAWETFGSTWLPPGCAR